MSARGHHEEFDRDPKVQASSDRSFGLVFTVFCAIVSISPQRHGAPVRIWASMLSGAFLIIAFARPSILSPFNRVWHKVGLLLGCIVNPVVMAILYYTVATPLGLIYRTLGKDPLRLRWDKACDTYWVPRKPPGPTRESMLNQL